jgi:hypothetical protein
MDASQEAQGAGSPRSPAPFARKATGLVRELSLLDIITYNASVATPLGVALAIALFYVPERVVVSGRYRALAIGMKRADALAAVGAMGVTEVGLSARPPSTV